MSTQTPPLQTQGNAPADAVVVISWKRAVAAVGAACTAAGVIAAVVMWIITTSVAYGVQKQAYDELKGKVDGKADASRVAAVEQAAAAHTAERGHAAALDRIVELEKRDVKRDETYGHIMDSLKDIRTDVREMKTEMKTILLERK